ncbi:parallel beta-helix repeat (two copies) [Desulfitobacterium dehalogenans ATCC 51507]|uniref:Parallel beta-helix repeat (Two copies) n=1 Tax=Desulfitobacterium dehalogenans (strain ATCC 51507 / DSM 9161 / JW/IU-DC1) TaxID=756499 RepID=I4A3Y5_DESDJ|nr:NosD domain-containing protein [Desulfitobacterium dehalogenans]AFL98669.1 parallel beta-helix repeat (two copies) [Desulfitobacterium dehalogenans ATCC 51507]
MKSKRNRRCFWLSLFFFLWVIPAVVQAATLEVRGGGSAESIQSALARAAPGDTINVYSGTYVGNIVIDKAISLIGIGTPILDGGGEGDVVSLKADGVNFKGFQVVGSGKRLQDSDAGIKIHSAFNVIEDNKLSNNLFGIYLLKSPHNTIRNNTIVGRPAKNKLKDSEKEMSEAGTYELLPLFEGESGDGIHLFAASNNLIENNEITDTRDGIYFNYAHDNRLLYNRINGVRYAIHYMYSDDNYFEGNIATNNVAGAAPMYSKRITFRQNVFAYNRGHRSFGVLFSSCNDCLAEGNIIFGNTRGALFDVSYHNTFRNNMVASNDIGIDLISSSGFNTFVKNNFVDNMEQIAFRAGKIGEGNVFYDEGEGNYWNDYRGFDLDQDGIGDTPYLTGDIFTYLMNKAPTVRLFLNSPAAKALEFAENMFPVIEIPKAEDVYPLIKPVGIEMNTQFQLEKNQVSNKVLGAYSLLMLLMAGIIAARAFRISSQGVKLVEDFLRGGRK